MTGTSALLGLDELEAALYAGLTRSDGAAMRDVLSEDLVYVHSTGIAESRRENLIGQASGLYRHGETRRLSGRTLVYGDLAVTSAPIAMIDTAHGEATLLNLEQTLVWARERDRWRLLLRQATRSATPDRAADAVPEPSVVVTEPGADPTGVEAVEAREDAFFAAQTASDVAALDDLMADDLTRFVHATGVVDAKAPYLANVRSGDYAHGRIELLNRTVRVLGTGAVSIGVIDLPVRPKSGPGFTMRLHHATVWAWRRDAWRLVVRHATRQPL